MITLNGIVKNVMMSIDSNDLLKKKKAIEICLGEKLNVENVSVRKSPSFQRLKATAKMFVTENWSNRVE